MSSSRRRDERRKEWDAELERLEAERHRKDSLSLWQRIEEADLSDDLKNILHRLANGERT